ncbi:MAG: peptidoglycan-binding protein, partial [Clostridia bacterium]|nr:peptidoglycan-binding protein [Clostridia bacterium]
IEAGFMTNFEEAKLMLDPDYVLLVAESACQGVCEYLDVEYIPRNNLSAYPVLSRRSRGNKVRLLQLLLNQYGYNLSADGVFGEQTYTAVTNFQQNNALTVDGVVGRQTWTALLNLSPSNKTIRRGARSSNVNYLQRKLLSKLYPITSLDNIFGAETENAVKNFQAENGLTADGIVGPLTWKKISQLGGGRQLN